MCYRGFKTFFKWGVLLAGLQPGRVAAHASEGGFVLLLPTDLYIMAGSASVGLTVLLLAVLPGRVATGLFRARSWMRAKRGRLPVLSSCVVAVMLTGLVWAGVEGPRDPLANPMPLAVWTVWWITLVSLQGVFGNLWHWINPVSGPAQIARTLGVRPILHLPHRLAPWIALIGFLGFAGFLLADISPSDPARLARIVAIYWLAMLVATLICGPRFLLRAEPITVLMRAYGRIGLFGRHRARLGAGIWGWQVMTVRAPTLGLATFLLVTLGSGSFDGLNETFWWFARLGINPLEFPGRSAVVVQNLVGLIAANLALVALYAASIALGLALSKARIGLHRAYCLFAPTILPIAIGYHIAHYLTSFMVDIQYTLIAASDPLARGWDLLGLGQFYVTTGFFNTQDTVRRIFLTQAGAVVIGHILAILLAHAIAVRTMGSNRQAVLSQAPLAVFMIVYTFFGLWLLASPRGV